MTHSAYDWFVITGQLSHQADAPSASYNCDLINLTALNLLNSLGIERNEKSTGEQLRAHIFETVYLDDINSKAFKIGKTWTIPTKAKIRFYKICRLFATILGNVHFKSIIGIAITLVVFALTCGPFIYLCHSTRLCMPGLLLPLFPCIFIGSTVVTRIAYRVASFVLIIYDTLTSVSTSIDHISTSNLDHQEKKLGKMALEVWNKVTCKAATKGIRWSPASGQQIPGDLNAPSSALV